ncbi:PRC and DUF2382 domain-containing protein [Corynebacterium sp.]|uniref:PRC and DUF2382 domain-containing protein n=1 Tax=Corynebacterium sp. TaxID=1720 RepID=UPI0026DF70FA|nr:PRC and DUF2382 domain-containing protein [Corynebacterium sp.]MDO5511485.1 PRC and DUF2382 domain-containing protein [Corynebacterium sp.]
MVNRNIADITRATAYDADGEKLGSVKEVYINDASGQPDFVEVGHGLFGMGSSLVPLRGHRLDGENLKLAFTKDRIEDAPSVDNDAHLTDEDQATIYRHFGLESTQNVETYDADVDTRDRAGYGTTDDRRDVVDRDVADRDVHAGVAADRDVNRDVAAEGEMVRSEERLNVDKERVATGEARLRKYVVRDTETVEVPVEREEVRLERTPIDADDAAAARGGALADDETTVTLSEERVNVTKETVPVEKVSLGKETVRDTETVSEDVAHEEIEVEGDNLNRDNRDLR